MGTEITSWKEAQSLLEAYREAAKHTNTPHWSVTAIQTAKKRKNEVEKKKEQTDGTTFNNHRSVPLLREIQASCAASQAEDNELLQAVLPEEPPLTEEEQREEEKIKEACRNPKWRPPWIPAGQPYSIPYFTPQQRRNMCKLPPPEEVPFMKSKQPQWWIEQREELRRGTVKLLARQFAEKRKKTEEDVAFRAEQLRKRDRIKHELDEWLVVAGDHVLGKKAWSSQKALNSQDCKAEGDWPTQQYEHDGIEHTQ